jgi:hypothetical protein
MEYRVKQKLPRGEDRLENAPLSRLFRDWGGVLLHPAEVRRQRLNSLPELARRQFYDILSGRSDKCIIASAVGQNTSQPASRLELNAVREGEVEVVALGWETESS